MGELVVLIRSERLLDRKQRVIERPEKPDRLIRGAPEIVRVHAHSDQLRVESAHDRHLGAVALEIAGELHLEVSEPETPVLIGGRRERLGVGVAEHGGVAKRAVELRQRQQALHRLVAVSCEGVEDGELDRTPRGRIRIDLLRVRRHPLAERRQIDDVLADGASRAW